MSNFPRIEKKSQIKNKGSSVQITGLAQSVSGEIKYLVLKIH